MCRFEFIIDASHRLVAGGAHPGLHPVEFPGALAFFTVAVYAKAG
jgi:hypothetical protein